MPKLLSAMSPMLNRATTRAGQSRLRRRRFASLGAVLIGALILGPAIGPIGPAYAESTTLYLKEGGTPTASLSQTSPTRTTLPNYDPQRDEEPGLLLEKSNKGSAESDPAKYQVWSGAGGDLELDGTATLSFWSAVEGFNTRKKGRVEAYLLDCPASGSTCSMIASGERDLNPWSSGADSWVQRLIDFGSVSYTLPADHSLAVKIVVGNDSGGAMWFAYDTVSYPAALTVETASVPPPSTAPPPPSAPTTTTTLPPVPPPATTTTAPPPPPISPTTTTAPPPPPVPTTTTTLAPRPSTTTTSTTRPPPATTTTAVPPTAATATTTPPTDTTLADLNEAAVPATGAGSEGEEISLGPLPEPAAIGSSPRGESSDRLSTILLDGLELAIPPSVATSLVSPLLLLESLIGAFIETGRNLLLPGLLLAVAISWSEIRRRRQRRELGGDLVESRAS